MEEQKTEQVSKASWLPVVWLILSTWRGRLAPGPGDPSIFEHSPPTMRIVYSILIMLSLAALIHGGIRRKGFIRNNPWIVCLYVLMGLSVLWSPYPYISFKRWIKAFGTLLMALLVLNEKDPLAAFCAIMRRYCLLTIPLSLFLCLFVPSIGIFTHADGRTFYAGIAPSRNGLAQLALMGAAFHSWVFLQHSVPRRPLQDVFILLISLYLMLACGSVTVFFSFLLFVGVVFVTTAGYLEPRHVGAIAMVAGFSGICLFFIIEGVIIRQPLPRLILEWFGRDMTLTGRTALWVDVMKMGMKHPLLGYGYGAFWLPDFGLSLWLRHDWGPTDAHNGYVDVFLDLGMAGLIVTFGMLAAAYKSISRSFADNFDFGRLRLALFAVVLLHNLAETSLCSLNHPYWFLLLFAAVTVRDTKNMPQAEFSSPVGASVHHV